MIVDKIRGSVNRALKSLYGVEADLATYQVNETKPEFEGDYTVVLFSLVKTLRKNPEQLGQELGQYLVAETQDFFVAFNVIKGFLNLTISDAYFIEFLSSSYADVNYGKSKAIGRK